MIQDPDTDAVGAAREPRYRALLRQARDRFPSEAQYRHWRRHYLSEVDRGEFIIATLRHYLPSLALEEARVLDVGCGDAGVPIAFAHRGARACGLEPSPPNARRGRIRSIDHDVPVGLVRGVGEALPYATGSFDLVLLDNVLEHVADRDATLAEIHRVLEPDGILYLVTPKPFALLSLVSDPHYHMLGLVLLPRSWQKRVVEWRLGAGSYDVGRIPTRRWVRRALDRAGFDSRVPPRELWIRYLRDRIASPTDIRPGVKRRLAGWLGGRDWIFSLPPVRWLLDIALGSNFFIARRRG